jgi:glycosyltransferase involved in cell wall biosynthesis
MKICIPIISLSRSGGIKVLTELANRAESLGHEAEIVVPCSGEPAYYDATCKVTWIDGWGREARFYPERKLSGIRKLIAIFLYLRSRSRDFDAVIANHNLTCYPVMFGSRVKNFYYIQAYEPEFSYEYGNIFVRYSSMLVAWLTYFFPLIRIVNSDLYLNFRNIRSKYSVTPGMDMGVFHPEENTRVDHTFTVGCIGRLERWKGTQDVSDAVRILREKGVKLKYRVAFTRVPVDGVYDFVEPIGSKGLAEFYRSLDVLVAPSHIQLGAIHYPVIEAMACGVPVITTGYFPANETNSSIVPVSSPMAIANAIMELKDRPHEAQLKSERALKDVSGLSWDVVVKKFYAVISENVSR